METVEIVHTGGVLIGDNVETVPEGREQRRARPLDAARIIARSPSPARIELLATFCHAWREGRGEKVGRVELEQSGASPVQLLGSNGTAGRVIG